MNFRPHALHRRDVRIVDQPSRPRNCRATAGTAAGDVQLNETLAHATELSIDRQKGRASALDIGRDGAGG
jgi:hypothetical protein